MNYILTKQITGIIWMMLHCLNFSVMSIMVRLCSSEGLPIIEIYFISTLFAFSGMLGWMIFSNERKLTLQFPLLYTIRVLFGALGMILWFYVLKWIPLTEATAISYLSPLFSAVAAILFLHERSDKQRFVALIVGFIGILIILRPGVEIVSIGALLAILVAVLWAIIDIATKIQSCNEKMSTQVFYITLFITIISLPLAISVWRTPTGDQWLSLALLGFVVLFNYFAIYQAYKFADLTLLLPFDFTRLLFTFILAYILFGEVMDIWSAVGAVIILSSAIYLAYSESKHNYPFKASSK